MGGYSHVYITVLLLSSSVKHMYGISILEELVSSSNVLSDPSSLGASDVTADTEAMISARGLPALTYTVTTQDGYILKLTRIPAGGGGTPRCVVLLIHGIFNSADDWLTQGEHALPVRLAGAGCDVWFANARGNKYNRHHVTLSPDQRAFWNFTFHEIGFYDLPASIDLALETTGASRLLVVAHSQGTTAYFVLASTRPKYNRKVALMVSLGTVTWVAHARSPPLRALVPLRYLEAELATSLGLYDVFSYETFKPLTARVCPLNKLTLSVCISVLFITYGFDYAQTNYSQMPMELGHIPAGASLKQLLHYAQLLADDTFRQFDYLKDNPRHYGTDTPPRYPVERVSSPVAILYADNDWISSYVDVQKLISQLPNVVDIYRVPFKEFNHMDYLWGKDANTLVYDKIMELKEKYYTSGNNSSSV